LFLSDQLPPGAIAAILITVAGVMVISVARTEIRAASLLTSLVHRSALIGLGSGAMFGLSAVCYRAASLTLGGPNFLMQAAVTLTVVILFQTVLVLAWMFWRERMEIVRVIESWKPSLIVGFAGSSA